MYRTTIGAALIVVGLIGAARADDESFPPAPASSALSDYVSPVAGLVRPFPPDIVPVLPNVAPQPTRPTGPANDLLNDRLSTPFATQTAGGGFQGRSFNEEFDGDFGGIFFSKTVQTGVVLQRQQVGTTTKQVQTGTQQVVVIDPKTGQQTIVTVPIYTTVTVPVFADVPVPVFQTVRVPVAGRYSGIMITDNDSPRPVDRLYFGYSYYDGLGSAQNPGFGDTTQARQLVGFEKTLFNGDVSVGMRLPFIQITAPFGSGASTVGDLSLLFKWAVINNRETGDILSVGMVLTTPTSAAGGTLSDGTTIPHSVLFQPWLGFVHTFGRGYFQFISNGILPTDSRDIYLWGNSLALGYRAYQGTGLFPSVTPTFEVHVRTPLNDRDPNGLVYLQDQVNLTGGAHFRWNRMTVSGAACIPVVGPRPWNIEAIANLNFRF